MEITSLDGEDSRGVKIEAKKDSDEFESSIYEGKLQENEVFRNERGKVKGGFNDDDFVGDVESYLEQKRADLIDLSSDEPRNSSASSTGGGSKNRVNEKSASKSSPMQFHSNSKNKKKETQKFKVEKDIDKKSQSSSSDAASNDEDYQQADEDEAEDMDIDDLEAESDEDDHRKKRKKNLNSSSTSTNKKKKKTRSKILDNSDDDDDYDDADDDSTLTEIEASSSEHESDFDDDDEDYQLNKRKRKGKKGSSKNQRNSGNRSNSRNHSNGIEHSDIPRIQTLLTRDSMKSSEWDKKCDKMNTINIKHGSRWITDASDKPNPDAIQERFLVKWKGESYIHVSWEVVEDLEDLTDDGKNVFRNQLRSLENREWEGTVQKLRDTFGDECFQADYKQIDRVIDEEIIIEKTDKKGEEPTEKIWCAVKWRGLGYDEVTWEVMDDLLDIGGMNAYLEMKRRNAIPNHLSTPDQRKMLQKSVMNPARPSLDADSLNLENAKFKNDNKLRNHQVVAVKWLLFNWLNRRGSILADEMGLGKTCQAIVYYQQLRLKFGVRGPVLIVAPLATLQHWVREFSNWTDFNAIVYHGNKESKEVLRQHEFFYIDPDNGKDITDCFKFDALITNYETAIADAFHLKKLPWSLLIVDEAHRMKNKQSYLFKVLFETFKYDSQLLLTGTPIQNSIEELYSLLKFADPVNFESWDEFNKKYGTLTNAKDVDKFHEMLKPYLLRRFKADMEVKLPLKEETIIEVELTHKQKIYYRAIYERNMEILTSTATPKANRFNLNNIAMQLRKCCIHPYLLDGVEDKCLYEIQNSQEILEKAAKSGNQRAYIEEEIMNSLISSSGKMILLDKLLNFLKENGRRVLIFSQMTRVLDILEDYLTHRQYGYERIDGSIPLRIRQEAIDRFSVPGSKSFCFLLSTRGCGQGINLTSADTVIMFDSDWNPQNDVQAQARCHRIGQTKDVQVYRLVTRKTYEWEMFQRAGKKLGLDQAILLRMADGVYEDGEELEEVKKKKNGNKSNEELEEDVSRLLKLGAYALTEDEEKARADEKAFCEADIHDLLKRSKVLKFEDASKNDSSSSSNDSNGNANIVTVGENKFSTATFVSSASGVVDIHDPDFWKKVIGEPVVKDDGLDRKRRRSGKKISYESDQEELADDDYKQDHESESENEVLYTEVSGVENSEGAKKKRSRRAATKNISYHESRNISSLDKQLKNVDGFSKVPLKDLMMIHSQVLTFGLRRWKEIHMNVAKLPYDLVVRLGRGILLTILYYCSLQYHPNVPNLIPQALNSNQKSPETIISDIPSSKFIEASTKMQKYVEEFSFHFILLVSEIKDDDDDIVVESNGHSNSTLNLSSSSSSSLSDPVVVSSATINSEGNKWMKAVKYIIQKYPFLREFHQEILLEIGGDVTKEIMEKVTAFSRRFFAGSFSDLLKKNYDKVLDHLYTIEALFAEKERYKDIIENRVGPQMYVGDTWWTLDDDIAILEQAYAYGWKYQSAWDVYYQAFMNSKFPGYSKAMQEYKQKLQNAQNGSSQTTPVAPDPQQQQLQKQNGEEIPQVKLVPPELIRWQLVSNRFNYLVKMIVIQNSYVKKSIAIRNKKAMLGKQKMKETQQHTKPKALTSSKSQLSSGGLEQRKEIAQGEEREERHQKEKQLQAFYVMAHEQLKQHKLQEMQQKIQQQRLEEQRVRQLQQQAQLQQHLLPKSRLNYTQTTPAIPLSGHAFITSAVGASSNFYPNQIIQQNVMQKTPHNPQIEIAPKVNTTTTQQVFVNQQVKVHQEAPARLPKQIPAENILRVRTKLMMFGTPRPTNSKPRTLASTNLFPIQRWTEDEIHIANDIVKNAQQNMQDKDNLTLLQNIERLSILSEFIDTVKPVALFVQLKTKIASRVHPNNRLPEGWDSFCDLNLLSAVCKFGLSDHICKIIIENKSSVLDKFLNEMKSGSLTADILLDRFYFIVESIKQYLDELKSNSSAGENGAAFASTSSTAHSSPSNSSKEPIVIDID